MSKFTEEYRQLQIDGSDWSYNSGWGDQMAESIRQIFKDVPRNYNILDVGCGEGRGLKTLVEMGFDSQKLVGVDLSVEKLNAARSRKFLCLEEDFHELKSIPSRYLILYTRHTH
jgi:ubiquinone/menaquinone biosynthesis C-methylase UbiE